LIEISVVEISVIIVSFNTRGLLRNCLESLQQHGGHLQVIVVDNHSTDASVEMVRDEYPEVRLIANSENTGFAKANNQGIREAQGKFVLLLNSDTVVRPGALPAMANFLKTQPNAGGVTGRVLNADGSRQACVSCRPGPAMLLFRLSGLSHLVRGDRGRRRLRRYLGWLLGSTVRSYLDPYGVEDSALEVENISAASLMLRREAIADVGLLDENFFMYFEDIDYCMRLQGAGWKLYYLPAGEIVHLVGQSSGGRMRNYSTHSYRSLFYFYRKYYSASSLRWGRLIVLTLSSLRWLWNFGLSLVSDSSASLRNCQDLQPIIRLCCEHPTDLPSRDLSNHSTQHEGVAVSHSAHERVSASGGSQ